MLVLSAVRFLCGWGDGMGWKPDSYSRGGARIRRGLLVQGALVSGQARRQRGGREAGWTCWVVGGLGLEPQYTFGCCRSENCRIPGLSHMKGKVSDSVILNNGSRNTRHGDRAKRFNLEIPHT